MGRTGSLQPQPNRDAGRPGRGLSQPAIGLGLALLVLAGCAEGTGPGFLTRGTGADGAETTEATRTRLVERDIEAPEVFQVTEAGLWDGRPSLGGVWVAHPDTVDPERVLIRNTANGKFVIGALFRRERELPGPRLQVSSDAAAALDLLAGAPNQLQVTALRREEVAEPGAAPAEADSTVAADGSGALAAPAVTETALDPVAGVAAGAIAAAEARGTGDGTGASTPPAAAPPASAAPPAAARVASAPAQPAPRAASGLDKPWLQIGIFSVEANARGAAASLRSAGMVPVVRQQESRGKTFWRVLVGPSSTASERDSVLQQVKAAGFTDAYAVTN